MAEACDGLLRARADTFGNECAMRTLWEPAREAHADRAMGQPNRTADDLVTIEAAAAVCSKL